MYAFRVFLSYAHEDEKLARRVAAFLKKQGLINMWDRSIDPGKPFTEEIKTRIECSHLFMPLITRNSSKRPWVHQETGCAMGMKVPVLPIAIGRMPDEMIRELHAAKVGPRLQGLADELTETRIEQTVLPPGHPPSATYINADHAERRAHLIAESAAKVRHLDKTGSGGRVRQRGAFSSFCLPDAPPDDRIWHDREGPRRLWRSAYYHELQWEERKELELHAKASGCELVLDPWMKLPLNGSRARRVRLETVAEFLRTMDQELLCLVLCRRLEARNLLIVGDWFSAESITPRAGVGYQQTLFTWHAPFVLYQVRQFDDMFARLGQDRRETANSSLAAAIARIEKIIRSIPTKAKRQGKRSRRQ